MNINFPWEANFEMDKIISAKRLLEWIETNDSAAGFWGNPNSRESFDNLTDAINHGEFSVSHDELIDKLREMHQMNIYTVDEHWCVQLFDTDVCANDQVDCIYENSGSKLTGVLIEALEWARDRVRQVS